MMLFHHWPWTGRRDLHPRSLRWERSVLLATPRPGLSLSGAPNGNRTRIASVENSRSSFELWAPEVGARGGPRGVPHQRDPSPVCCVPAQLSKGTRTTRSPLLVRGPGNPDGVRTRANKKPRARFRGRGLNPFQGSVYVFTFLHPAPQAALSWHGCGGARPRFPGLPSSGLGSWRWTAAFARVARCGRGSSRKSVSFQSLSL